MSEHHLLAVETSSKLLSVAIQTKNGVLFERDFSGTPKHSEQLMGTIDLGLKSLKLQKDDLDHLLWGVGPGSFTGLRIGMSVLKGLHLGLAKEAFGASSLDLIALGCDATSGYVVVGVDARRGHIYSSIFEFRSGKMRCLTRDLLLTYGQLCERLDELAQPITFVGDALVTYGNELRATYSKRMRFLDSTSWYPHATQLLQLWQKNPKWFKSLTLRTMVPQYLRCSEAEDKYDEKVVKG